MPHCVLPQYKASIPVSACSLSAACTSVSNLNRAKLMQFGKYGILNLLPILRRYFMSSRFTPALLLSALLFAPVLSKPAPAQEPAAPVLLAPGTVAPDFTANTPDGTPVHLSDYKGKVVVLDMWATWCPPCQASLPHTNEVAKEFAPKGVTVLAVCVSDTKDAFDGWLPKHKEYSSITFAFDPSGRKKPSVVNKLYHVSGIPTQYVIGKDGKVVTSFVGYGGPTSGLADALTKATAAP